MNCLIALFFLSIQNVARGRSVFSIILRSRAHICLRNTIPRTLYLHARQAAPTYEVSQADDDSTFVQLREPLFEVSYR